jgi:chromatin remodeling complex protein RSC6
VLCSVSWCWRVEEGGGEEEKEEEKEEEGEEKKIKKKKKKEEEKKKKKKNDKRKNVEYFMLAKPLLSQILGPVRTLKDKPPRLDTQL